MRGYTRFTQQRGSAEAGRLAAKFAEIAREGVEAHAGSVIELRGDEALAVFRSVERAVRAAVELQAVFADETALDPSLPLGVGIGIDAGEAVPIEGGYRGRPLNLAARLAAQATAGEVVVSEGAIHLAGRLPGIRIEPGGSVELKGFEEPVPMVRLRGEGTPPSTDGPSTRGGAAQTVVPPELDAAGAPLAGRDRELRWLRWEWRRARRGPGRAIVLAGPPGIGKRRLAAALAADVARDGACVTYAAGSTVGTSVMAALQGGGADGSPTLIVLDGADGAGDLGITAEALEARRVLLVALVTDVDRLPDAIHALRPHAVTTLGPLDADAVRQMAALYAGDTGGVPAAEIVAETGGMPSRVVRAVAAWARREAVRRLGEAAGRAAEGRSDLRAREAELAENVIDLQLMRERSRLLSAVAVDSSADEPPFKGLASFDVGDTDLFFGRERLVAEIVARLAGSTLLGVVGPSGSGKSSAVRAGLLPALEADVLPGSSRWRRVVMRPGEDPFRQLDRALWGVLTESERHRLAGSDAPLADVLAAIPAGEMLVLVIDQFEELFTSTDEATRTAFIRALVEGARDPARRLVVVLAIRADFYGRCAAYQELAALLGPSHVLVGAMTPDEYRRAIEGPARQAGLAFEPSLVDALVDDVVHEPGALPLLSTALLELWRLRTGRAIGMEAYARTGGVRGAVARLADQAYEQLSEEQRRIARAILLRLAGPGEGESIVRRRVALSEFDAERNVEVAAVLSALTGQRLVTVSEGTVEVAHEALLREWPRLQAWVEEDRAGRRLHQHLIQASKEWAASGRDPGELYRGARLAAALDWTAEHGLELNELERDFLSQSRSAGEREALRQQRTNRRLRTLLAGTAVMLVAALVAGSAAFLQRSEAQRAAAAEARAAIAAEARSLGAQAVIEDDLDLSLLLARQAFAIDDSIDTRSTLFATLLKAPAAVRLLPGTGNRVLRIKGSLDGQTFVTIDHLGILTVYDATTMHLTRTVRLPGQASFAVHPAGRTIVATTYEGRRPVIATVDVTTGSVTTEPLPEDANHLSAPDDTTLFAPDGSSFLTLELRGRTREPAIVRRSNEGDQLGSPVPLGELEGAIRMAFTASGDRLFVVDRVKTRVLDGDSLETIKDLPIGGNFDVSPDGRTAVYGDDGGGVTWVDVESGQREPGEGRHTARVQSVQFSPDGESIVTTGDDRLVIVWDAETRSVRESLRGHAGRVWGTAFDPAGTTAFTVGLDGRVFAWDLSGDRRLGTPFMFGERWETPFDATTALSPDGRRFAMTTPDGTVMIQDVATRRVIWEGTPWQEADLRRVREADRLVPDDEVTGDPTALAFSPDGAHLAVAARNVEVAVLDVATGEVVHRWIAGEYGWVNAVAYGPAGVVATGGDDGRLALWDAASGSLRWDERLAPAVTDIDRWTAGVLEVALSPDGRRVASTIGGQVPVDLHVHDAESGARLWQQRDDLWAAAIAWSPDGRLVATGGEQTGDLVVRDAGTGERIGEPAQAVSGPVHSVAFASTNIVVTAGGDGTVRLWDATNLRQIGANIPAVDNQPAFAHVAAGGQQITVLTIAGQGWIWSLDPDDWARRACDIANRNLSESEWAAFLPGRPYEATCAPS